jgi:hypothetical protein
MTTHSDMIYQFGGAPVSSGIPFGPKANYFFVDPASGSDGNSGQSLDNALATVQAAYELTTSGQHDTVFLIAGATASAIAASIAWAKDYVHLIGVGCELPGVGQRARITGSSTVDATSLINVTGSGCIFRNLQLFNGGDANAISAAAIVAGSRNHFQNVFFAGMGHATPAANANGYSLLVLGHENCFDACTIGLDTIKRTTNRQLKVSGARNTFRNCHINSYCETSNSFMVQIDSSVDDMRWNRFVDCLFYNYRENWGTAITDCFDMPAGGYTHDVILQGNCMMYGCTGWADTTTHLIHMLAAPASGGGVGIAVNA